MPSVLYSTHCSIKNDLYRLRIYLDDSNSFSLSNKSDEFTSVDIPTDLIQASSTRLHFQLIDQTKKSNRLSLMDIPENLPLHYLLQVNQTVSAANRKKNISIDQISNVSAASNTPILVSTEEPNTPSTIQRQSSFFRRLFSSKSTNSQSNGTFFPKTSVQLDFVDVSNEIQWTIKTIFIELDSEDLAMELTNNLNLCLSTLKQRPRRLVAFVNPLSGKGRARCVFDKKVLPIFQRANVFVETIYTERANQARDYVMQEALTDFDGLICVGGDGMFAELCHGLLLRSAIEANVDINNPQVNLVRPQLRIGIIPAGSTDAVVFGTTGLNDPVTSALQIIVGETLSIDITTVHNENGFVRFMATMLAYGFFGDIIHQSDRWRCLGPLRYDLAGFFQFIRNTSYHSELTITLSPHDPVSSLSPPPTTTTATAATTMAHPMANTAAVAPDLQQLLSPEINSPKVIEKVVSPVSPFCSRNCGKCAEDQLDSTSVSMPIQIKREGRYTTVNCLNMPCRCAKSKYGMSPFVHLGDGTFDLLLVKRSWQTGFLRFLWQVANDGRSIEDLPNVERYRVSEVLIRPINTGRKRLGNWSCDGELIYGNEIQVRVHRQALNLFASGIVFKVQGEEMTKKKGNYSCCSCFGKGKCED